MKSALPLLITALILSACDDGNVSREFHQAKEFIDLEKIGGYSQSIHFVHVDPSMVGSYGAQIEASRKLCKEKGNEICEIYMWSDKGQIPDTFPFVYSYSRKHKISGSLDIVDRGHYKRDHNGSEKLQILGRDKRYDKGITSVTKANSGWSKKIRRSDLQESLGKGYKERLIQNLKSSE